VSVLFCAGGCGALVFFFLNGVSKKAKKDFVFVAQILQSDSVEKKQKKF
jgi:hypothetical protein